MRCDRKGRWIKGRGIKGRWIKSRGLTAWLNLLYIAVYSKIYI